MRGRQPEEIVQLLSDGIEETKTRDIPVKVILKESEAIDYAYENAQPGSLITIMCDVVTDALEQVKKIKEYEDKI